MILQKTLPYDPYATRALPGIQPLAIEDWLRPDEAAAAQIEVRRELMAQKGEDVLRCAPGAMEAAQELLAMVRDHLFVGQGDYVTTAAGDQVALDFSDPMASLCRITQQDFCILEKPEGAREHVLTAAALCFPASWRLREKYLLPLTRIHVPVPEYDAQVAKRVQRLFDGVQVGRPLWRFNALWYARPDLFHADWPPVETCEDRAATGNFLRSETQSVLRLPKTRAVVFSIHTRVVARSDVEAQFGRAVTATG